MKKVRLILESIIIIVGILAVALFILFYLALSGHLFMKTKRDVRSYLKEKYEMTGEKISFTGKDPVSTSDRRWLVQQGNGEEAFCVYQEGNGWQDEFRLVDNRKDIALFHLYHAYVGEKETFQIVIVKENRYEEIDEFVAGEYATAYVLATFYDDQSYQKCVEELDAFSIYLKENEMNSFPIRISTKTGLDDATSEVSSIIYTDVQTIHDLLCSYSKKVD